jgi:hypothetical protein
LGFIATPETWRKDLDNIGLDVIGKRAGSRVENEKCGGLRMAEAWHYVDDAAPILPNNQQDNDKVREAANAWNLGKPRLPAFYNASPQAGSSVPHRRSRGGTASMINCTITNAQLK